MPKVGGSEDWRGEWGVPGKNSFGNALVDVCLSTRLSIMNTWFNHRRVDTYTDKWRLIRRVTD